MNKRVGAIEEFGFECLSDHDDLHITIAVTGWLTETDGGTVMIHWSCLLVPFIA